MIQSSRGSLPEGLTELMLELEIKDKILADQTRRLYNFHNLLFPLSPEHNRACPSCRFRVYNKVKDYYEKNK
jgi:hypothetical protein